jgi:hypothetical protein
VLRHGPCRELHDRHSAQFKSWGRFAVFDSLLSRMTDEVEFEAIRRTKKTSKSPVTVRDKPVTVVLKRAIRDEKATRTWQQMLAGNNVRWADGARPLCPVLLAHRSAPLDD